MSASKAEDYSKDQKVVQKVEQSLSDRGYRVGKIDGKLDGDSKSSLKKFQRTQGFEATGKLDRETLSALGVEPSEMAGASGSEYGTSEQSGQWGESPSMEPAPAATPFEQPGQTPESNEDVAPFPSDVGRSNESGGMTH